MHAKRLSSLCWTYPLFFAGGGESHLYIEGAGGQSLCGASLRRAAGRMRHPRHLTDPPVGGKRRSAVWRLSRVSLRPRDAQSLPRFPRRSQTRVQAEGEKDSTAISWRSAS